MTPPPVDPTDPKRIPLPWWPRDFMSDPAVQRMTLEEEGAYRRLLDHQWVTGHVPDHLPTLRVILNYPHHNKVSKLWGKLKVLFPPLIGDPTLRANAKLERVRAADTEFRLRKSLSAKAAVETRWARKRAAVPTADAYGRNTDVSPESYGRNTLLTTTTQISSSKKISESEEDHTSTCIPTAAGSSTDVSAPSALHGVLGVPLDPAIQVARAANAGFASNPAMRGEAQLRPLTHIQAAECTAEWLAAGIPLDRICDTVRELCARYRPTPRSPRVTTFRYFDRAILEAADQRAATPESDDARLARLAAGLRHRAASSSPSA